MKTNFRIFSLAWLFFILASFLFAENAGAKILISKVQISGKTSTDEFVELYNNDSSPASLAGFSLKKQTKSGKQYALVSSFPTGAQIASNGYFMISHKNYTNSYKIPDLFYTNKSNSLSENNSLLLLDEKGIVVDKIDKIKAVVASSTIATSTIKTKQKITKPQGPTAVEGRVIALPDTFGSQYFYLSTANGGYQVYNYKKDFPALTIGNLIRVAGLIQPQTGATRIKTKNRGDITVLKKQQPASSTLLTLQEINDDSLGTLITVNGELTEMKSGFFYLDNKTAELPIYLKSKTQIDKNQLTEGDSLTITGILEKTKTGRQLWPRSQADIVINETAVDKKIQSASKQNNYFWYVVISAMGAAAIIVTLLLRRKYGHKIPQ